MTQTSAETHINQLEQPAGPRQNTPGAYNNYNININQLRHTSIYVIFPCDHGSFSALPLGRRRCFLCQTPAGRDHIFNPSGGSALHADRCGLSLRPRPARVNWTFWTLSGRVVTWCAVDTVYGAFQPLTRYVDNTLCHHSIHVKGDTFTDALLLPYEYTAR